MTGIQSPPAHFNQLTLLTIDVDVNTLVRMAWPDSATHCKFRNEIRFRFDAPDASFGVLYAAFDVATAFAETVLRDKPALATAAAGGGDVHTPGS
jgi:RES domain